MKKINTQKGIALYTAIIVAGIVLLLAVAMTDIAFRQLVLARTALNSQHAFYIADTGVECALYYDVGRNVFPSNSVEFDNFDANLEDLENGEIVCADDNIISDDIEVIPDDEGKVFTTKFTLNLPETAGVARCAVVTVAKEDTVGGVSTGITIDGRYPCDTSQTVERTIHVTYGS